MSRGRTPATHRGPRPSGTLTLEEAARLPVFAGKSDETVRRKIGSARVGFWQPEGSKGSLAIFDAERVRSIVRSLAEGHAPRTESASSSLASRRPRSKLPHGRRDGWATADEIHLLLNQHGIDATYFTARWLRERLLKLGIPSERRVVTVRVERVFPIDKAVAVLQRDSLVQARIGR